MHDTPSGREPAGHPLPVAVSYLHTGKPLPETRLNTPRGLRAAPFMKSDAAQDV